MLHKLNYDFVDPGTSCASYMYRRVAETLPLLPRAAWAEHIAIWGTLAAEAALPIILLCRATWQLGLVAALSFHLMLSFDPTPGIYSFTALLFALFVLVLPNVFIEAATTTLASLSERLGRRTGLAIRAAGALFLAAMLGYGATRDDRWAFGVCFFFFLAWAGAVIVGYLYCLARLALPRPGVADVEVPSPRVTPIVDSPRAGPDVPLPRNAGFAPALLWVLPCLVLLTGLNPYLGLRTQLSFSMFSNLRTEGGVSNHLFMPRLASLTSYQDDLVEILDSDDPELAELSQRQLLLPYFELRRQVSGAENVNVHYRRGGEAHTFVCEDGRCNDAELAQPYSRLMGRLLYFRPVDKGARMLCRH